MKVSSLNKITASIILATALLVGCSGKEEREAKYLQNAQEYFDQENIDKAKIEIKNVLQINPNNAKARYLLALMDEKEQNWKGMFSNLSVAIETDPKLMDARYKLGLLYVASGSMADAEKQVKAMQEAEPNNADTYALQAVIAQRQEKPEEAERLAKKALEVDPANIAAVGILTAQVGGKDAQQALDIVTEALKKDDKQITLKLLKLRLLEEQGKTEEVVGLFQEIIKDKPETINTYFQLSQYLVSKQRVDEAETILRKAVEVDPENAQPKLWLVGFYAQNKTPEEARALLEKFNKEDKENADIRNALASSYIRSKENTKAKELYKKVIDADPKSSAAIEARNKLIVIADQEKDRKTIDTLLKEVLEIEPENPDALLIRSSIYRMEGDLDAAIADLRVARKAKPDSVEILLALASAQEASGIKELALENYRAALALQPDNRNASVGAARLLWASGDTDKATTLLEPVLKSNPENIDAIDIMMSIYIKQEKWEEAMELVNPLLLRNESAPLGFLLKARVLAIQKKYKEAREALEQSLAKRLSPEALRDLVTLHVSQKKTDEAFKLLNDIIAKEPKLPYPRELLAGVYLATGKNSDAEPIYARLINDYPQEAGYYRKQVQTYLELKKSPQDVIALIDSGLPRVENKLELLGLKAEYYQMIDKPLEALAIYEEMLQKNPKSQLLQNNIVALILDYAPTKENLEKAQKLSANLVASQSPALLDTVGWLQYKLGNYPQALSLLQDARKKGSKGAVYDYHLGMAYYQTGSKDKAKELLEAALSNEKEKFVGKDEAKKILGEFTQ
jgi:tetratricopeptide (TPR) repeat protein